MGRNLGERKGPVAMVKKTVVFEISLVGPEVSNLPANARRPRFDPRVRKIPWRRERQPTPVF